jgi:hypothetical protein
MYLIINVRGPGISKGGFVGRDARGRKMSQDVALILRLRMLAAAMPVPLPLFLFVYRIEEYLIKLTGFTMHIPIKVRHKKRAR